LVPRTATTNCNPCWTLPAAAAAAETGSVLLLLTPLLLVVLDMLLLVLLLWPGVEPAASGGRKHTS
jgi:hypothetical protein